MSCMIEQPVPMHPTTIGDHHMINDNCTSSMSENFHIANRMSIRPRENQRIHSDDKTIMHKKNIKPENRITFGKKQTLGSPRQNFKNTATPHSNIPITPYSQVNPCITNNRGHGGSDLKSSLKRKVSFNENMTNVNKRAKKSCKNVVFASHVNIRKYLFDCISMVDKEKLWYDVQDLENFRRQAKTIIDHARENGCDGIDYRGLESRICGERLAFRHISTRTVLKCQRYLDHKRQKIERDAYLATTTTTTMHIDANTKQSNEEQQIRLKHELKLASIAGKCSRWATAIALETAQKDHLEIYGTKSATV